MDCAVVRVYKHIIDDLLNQYPQLATCSNDICQVIEELCASFRAGNKLMVCGNGGSAADSEHIVGELMKSFKTERAVSDSFKQEYKAVIGEDAPAWLEGALPAISLVSHTALSTAFSNDESAIGIFAQQVFGYGQKGDVLLCISTSGNSANVLEAAKVAKAKGVLVISLTGARKASIISLSDICISVPEIETYKVQELHLPVYHAICASVEAVMFGE